MAAGISKFLKPGEIHKLHRLVFESRYVVEGNLSGGHRSPQKGVSSEFADHRSYFPGDDPKRIDWKVFGRTDRYYVKRYEDQTNLRVYILVDCSGSMGYASGKITKYEYACHLAAALGYVIVKARDSVGLFLYSDKIDATMEARNSLLHLNNLLKLVDGRTPGSSTQIARTLHQIAESIRKRALVVILSDLFDDTSEVIRAMAHFRKQHHDVVVMHVLDPAELDLPFSKGAEFVDMETDETIITDPRTLAEAYRKVFGEFMESYRKGCAEMSIDYRLARTDQRPESFARAYLEERRRFSR